MTHDIAVMPKHTNPRPGEAVQKLPRRGRRIVVALALAAIVALLKQRGKFNELNC